MTNKLVELFADFFTEQVADGKLGDLNEGKEPTILEPAGKNELLYSVRGKGHDSSIHINGHHLENHEDLEKHFPKATYGKHKFTMYDHKSGKRYDDGDSYSYAAIHRDLKNFGNKA